MYEKLYKEKGLVWDSFNNCPGQTRLWSSGPGCSDLGSYIDFTSSAGIEFWNNGIQELLKYGIEGIWNDNNEFSISNDDFVLANGQKIGRFGRANLTLEMAKQSFLAMQEFRNKHNLKEQPFLITRSGSVGSHTFAAQSWSGDNYTNWKTLQHNIPMGLNAGLCLLPGYGHDVGGFAGPVPGPELFLRWVQNGIFHPRFTIHSWKHKEGIISEPWMYPEVFCLYNLRMYTFTIF